MMKKRNRGQSFFELIIAVLIVSIVLIALVSLATRNVSLTTYSRNKTLATRHAQETLEWLRGERDADWNTFYNSARNFGNSCMPTLGWTSGSCTQSIPKSDPNETSFFRRVQFPQVSNTSVESVVIISWSDGSGQHESRASTVLTNWKRN